MSEAYNEPESQAPRPAPLSLARVLMVVVPIALIGVGAYAWTRRWESQAREQLANNSFNKILTTSATGSRSR